MIDTHCHILPMCDDGPAQWNQSIELGREAIRQGITSVIATPHHGKAPYCNAPDKIHELVRKMNQLLVMEGIPLTVWSGQEYHLGLGSRKEFALDSIRTLGDSKYVLVELPSRETPKYLHKYIHFLFINQLTPIIAHPERHIPFIRKPRRLAELVLCGVRCQLTAPSLVGHYGAEVQRFAWTIVRNGWIHLLASDAHDLDKRGFRLREAYWLLEAGMGEETVKLLRSNAERLIQGEPLLHGEAAIPYKSNALAFWRKKS